MKIILIIITLVLAVAVAAGAETYRNKWVMIGSDGGVASSEEFTNYAIIKQPVIGEATDGKYTHRGGFAMILNTMPGLSAKEDILLLQFDLNQNYPNPFNSSTTINYSLAGKSNVRLDTYNILGQKVETLIDAEQDAGFQSVQ
ncbi:MAG: hypothetical protein GY855_16560 [candidate division Zixibacteria bacterium]|nr:hypothetical protein [candidate division Zixibacteria bacterium]